MFGRKRIEQLTKELTVSRLMFSQLLTQYGEQMNEIESIKASNSLARGRVVTLEQDLAEKAAEIEELKEKLKFSNSREVKKYITDDTPKFENSMTTIEFLTRKVIEHEKRNKNITDRCIKLDMRLINIKEELADANKKIKELESKDTKEV